MWRYLSCVSCVCVLGLGCAFISFWVCRVMVCLVVGFILLFCVSPCSCVRCLVFCACCSFCVFMFWCLVMSSPVGTWSLISHCDRCIFGSVSYLIFSDKILSGVIIVCLSSIHCCIFSSFLFIWIE